MPDSKNQHRRPFPRWAWIALGFIAAYLFTAYVILPQFDKRKARLDHDVADWPHLTHTGTGLPGDPLNIALVGSEEDVVRSMTAAGWYPADPLTFASSVRIAVDTVFKKPDESAPSAICFCSGARKTSLSKSPSEAARRSVITSASGARTRARTRVPSGSARLPSTSEWN